jgi:hypothetical protein
MKAKYKIIATIIVIIILIFILFIKYEQELVFIKYLPITMKMAVNYDVGEYKIIVPLHKFAFIKDMDFYLKSSIDYFTFLNSKEINNFYDKIKEEAKLNYKVYESENIFIYYDEKNNTYTIVPAYHIDNEEGQIKNVRLDLIDKNAIREIIESVEYNLQTDTWRKIKLEKFGLSKVCNLSSAEIEEFKSYLNSTENVDVKIPEKQAFQYRIKVEKVLVDEINIEYWELYKIDGDNYIKDPQNNIIKIKSDMLNFLNDVYDN